MRALAALVMIPVAVGVAYAGGWWWSGLATLVAIGLYIEWLSIVGLLQARLAIVVGAIALVAAAGCVGAGQLGFALACVAAGIVGAAAVSPERKGWAALGVIYAAAALIASILVRADAVAGFATLIFVLLVVWVTDIGGYFFGRGLGGPKLWVRVSPNKTWAGAIGGVVMSLLVAGCFAAAGYGKFGSLALLALVLTVSSQLGDLAESAVKRKFGVKDSSQIIPGHGGLLDRLDGYVFAIVVAAMIGFMRSGGAGVGSGLVIW